MEAAITAEETLAAGETNDEGSDNEADTEQEDNQKRRPATNLDDIDESSLDPESIKNQFNYSYRETQTPHTSINGNWFANMSDKSTETQPPPIMEFSATATQWEIYDSYIQHFENQKKQQEQQAREQNKKRKRIGQGSVPGSTTKLGGDTDTEIVTQSHKAKDVKDILQSNGFSGASKLMERILNQNSFEDIVSDFKVRNNTDER